MASDVEIECLCGSFTRDHDFEVDCHSFVAMQSIPRLLILKWWLSSIPRLTEEQGSVPLPSSFRPDNSFHHKMHECELASSRGSLVLTARTRFPLLMVCC